MKSIRWPAVVAILLTLGAAGAPGQVRPAFEVASIKPDDDPARSGFLKPAPGTLTSANISVKSYIQWAWQVEGYQISVPAPLKAIADSRYAIAAKADGPAPVDQIRLMLQRLLEERFHLSVHFEKRDLSVFALVMAKDGPKQLRDPAPGSVPHMDIDPHHADSGQHWMFYDEPVAALIGIMSNGLGRPIVDMTGIKGAFDFAFVLPDWNRAEGPLGDHVVSDVFPEIQRQLGLRVEARTAPIDVMVIDHIDKSATDN